MKIAILDTGIDCGHYCFEAYRENIRGTFNSYNERLRKNVQDLHGHGTSTASLILKYAPDAELYIIKIAEKQNARPDAEIVANVSNWTGSSFPCCSQELTRTGNQPRS